MCDDEIAALVVDNGSGMCKAGFAGDDAPRYMKISDLHKKGILFKKKGQSYIEMLAGLSSHRLWVGQGTWV